MMNGFFSSASSSKSKSLTRPAGVDDKINDSLFALYSPEKESIASAEFDVVFVHGIQEGESTDAYWTTWFSEKGGLWPRTMLAKKFPKARILSVTYDSSAETTGRTGRYGMTTIAEKLLHDVVQSTRADVGQNRRFIMVGYNLGGLVIKSLLLNAWKKKSQAKIAQFFVNLKGFFYYSTPHGGTKVADKAAEKNSSSSPVLQILRGSSKETQRLNEQFRNWREMQKVPVYTLYEMFPTQFLGANQVFVTEASAIQDSDKCYPVDSDHINICKPDDFNSNRFSLLEDFIVEMAVPEATVEQTLPWDLESRFSSLEEFKLEKAVPKENVEHRLPLGSNPYQ